VRLVTSARMYNAVPKAAAAWRALFDRVFADAGVSVEAIAHGHPEPIESLWREPGLVASFMCGWPFARSELAMQPIAAPVPSPPQYESLPRYRSEFLVRAASGWTRVEDAFGHRFGWMATGSHSGFNAPRAFLSHFTTPGRPRLFRESVGPLGNPAAALDALKSGAVDMIALYSYWLDLVRHHDSARLDGAKTVGHTAWAPIPLLVAAPGVDVAVTRSLRDVLLGAHERPEYGALLTDVVLERFVAPDVTAYSALENLAADAERTGYATIA